MGVRTAVNARVRWAGSIALALIALGCHAGHATTVGAMSGRDSTQLPPPVLDSREVFPAGMVPVAGMMHNPDAGDSNAAKIGEKLFSSMNCDGCHGGGATGWVGPSLVDGRWRYGSADGNLFQSIYYGRPKGMPAYGKLLPPGTIWDLVTYIRSQPIPPDVPTETWPRGNK